MKHHWIHARPVVMTEPREAGMPSCMNCKRTILHGARELVIENDADEVVGRMCRACGKEYTLAARTGAAG